MEGGALVEVTGQGSEGRESVGVVRLAQPDSTMKPSRQLT